MSSAKNLSQKICPFRSNSEDSAHYNLIRRLQSDYFASNLQYLPCLKHPLFPRTHIHVSMLLPRDFFHNVFYMMLSVDQITNWIPLTGGIFETGAYVVPSKSQNPTVSGRGGPSSSQFLAGHVIGTIGLVPSTVEMEGIWWCQPHGANEMPS